MVITCENCGSDRFRAGEIELNEAGGYTVVMPCATCGTPSKVIQEQDPGLAKALVEFFGESGPGKFAHELGS